MKKLRMILQSRYFFKILAFILVGYSIFLFLFFHEDSNYSGDTSLVVGEVISYEIDGNQCIIYLKAKEKLVIYYYFQTEQEKIDYQKRLELGMKLRVKGEFINPDESTIPNGFNYCKYLLIHHIHYVVQATSLTIEEKNTSILYGIKNVIINRCNRLDKTGYFRAFLLGDKTKIEDNILETYRHNGVTHLFSISGMHIGFIVGILMFFLDKVSYHRIYKYTIVNLMLFFYLFLTNFSASVIRTVVMFFLFSLNDCFHLKLKKIDLMFLVLSVAILIDNFILFDVGFQYSYVISFFLILFGKKIEHQKSKVIKNLMLSGICFMVSFPICVYYFYQVNVLSILFNLIMIPFVSVIIFPMTVITFFLPILYPIYDIFIKVLEGLNQLVGNFHLFEFVFVKPSMIVILLYYFFILLGLFQKRYLFLLGLLIFLHKTYPCWDSNFNFTVLDVGQGDSLFLKLPYNQGNILIDTGGLVTIKEEDWKKQDNNYSLAMNKIIPYLTSLGIPHLDALILTHGDYDHMGESINLVENFKVEKVVFNCGEYNDLEKELINVLDKKKITYYSCIKEINIDNNKLYFLNNKDYGNENDNSSVIYTELNNYKFLFMGDAGVEVEEDLIEKYNLQDIDILKVGHHGSKTSSGKEFIDETNPKYSIISVGKNNRYGHPKESVLYTLSDSKIYRTDLDGSIEIKLNKNGYEIKTCPP